MYSVTRDYLEEMPWEEEPLMITKVSITHFQDTKKGLKLNKHILNGAKYWSNKVYD